MVLRGVSWAFLGLGSNIEDRLEYLQSAVDGLHAHSKVRIDAVSSIYETDPVGGPEQDPYLNMAVRAATLLSPRALLKLAHTVEAGLGRVRDQRWGPRTIDVDILTYDKITLHRRHLELPHPRLTQRPFALVPLLEVAPGMKLPDGQSVASALAALAPIEGVTMVGSQVGMPRDPAP